MGNLGNGNHLVNFILVSMKEKNLILAIGINIIITIVEITVGLFIGSLAIISDAVHNFFDVGAMMMSLLGERASSKKIDEKHSYGYKRTEVLIALLNSVFLLVSIIVIGYEAIQRLFHPQIIEGRWMLGMAVIAFIGNLIATKLLHDHAKESMNIRSAFLHSFQDALFSGGVIIAAILVLLFKWQWADAGISLVLSVFLAKEAMSLILVTVHILMEGVPENLDINELKKNLLRLDKVKEVNDLHIWSNGSKDIMMTTHIVADLKNNNEYLDKLTEIKRLLFSKYKINHSTIQLVPSSIQDELTKICKHCS